MNKPINITIEETKQAIVDIVNECKLPPAAIELILENIRFEINHIKINALAKEQKILKEQMEKESAEK